MKKIVMAIAAVATLVFASSCSKTDSKKDSRPVCTKVVFTISSTGFSKDILDLFRINISGVDFSGNAFSSNGVASYVSNFEINTRIDSSEDHCPFKVKMSVEKKAEPDPAKSYSFPHNFYIKAEFYDEKGNKLMTGSLDYEDVMKSSYGDNVITYKGDRLEQHIRRIFDMQETTYVFFRHQTENYFGCTTK